MRNHTFRGAWQLRPPHYSWNDALGKGQVGAHYQGPEPFPEHMYSGIPGLHFPLDDAEAL